MRISCLAALLSGAMLASCGGGGEKAASGGLRLIQFLESGRDGVVRNKELTFLFSAPIAPTQNLSERLKIRSMEAGGAPEFAPAIGTYRVNGDRVTFAPRLPNEKDRADAGFRAKGEYLVFLKGGPDGLLSASGDQITTPQEFAFATSEFFADPIPSEPPRAIECVAKDVAAGTSVDLSRVDPRPNAQAQVDNLELITSGRVVEPGAGGAPDFETPWRFELRVSEPIDPATVTTETVELVEIFSDATTSGDTAPPDAPAGHFGTPVRFKVPITVETDQRLTTNGVLDVRIRVTPRGTLVDDTRYRLTFSGDILGLDFRKQFIGANGLTGDGETVLSGAGLPVEEPGGLGYTTEFVVRDRPAILSERTLTYDPLVDGIEPETGETSLMFETRNSALYNPPSSPGTAVGFSSGFGDGSDGPLDVSGGATVFIDTGDTPNEPLGNPFTVLDLNPDEEYDKADLTKGLVTYDSYEYFELNLSSLTISSGSTLRVTGVNPVLFRVSGIVQITGTLDVAGASGQDAAGTVALGGEAGAGGGSGGECRHGTNTLNWHSHTCDNFSMFLSQNAVASTNGPYSDNGEGPGRGMRGGESYSYGDGNDIKDGVTGTGGGGGSHAAMGAAGEDRFNANGAPGSPGPACGHVHSTIIGGFYNESVIGVRGEPGPTYGDSEVVDVTWGGSGGGAGGTVHGNSSWNNGNIGGGGGGGGGSVAIYAASSILVNGGSIDASGGDGGKGRVSPTPTWTGSNYRNASGAGGAGAGGTIVLLSANALDITAGLLDASGGTGGARGNAGTSITCNGCNGGGDGGKGFIFLMDADGEVTGLSPFLPGVYPDFAMGHLTIRRFDLGRFDEIKAVTELFYARAADPEYLDLTSADVLATVSTTTQSIEVYASSAKADVDDPLRPDLTTELDPVLVALVHFTAGSTTVDVFDNMDALNPSGAPARDSHVRIVARFLYGNPVEAALGPFASMDRLDIPYRFNG